MTASPNPALARLSVLVGEWHTTGTHPAMPGEPLHGRVTFAWIEGGAFLKVHSAIDHPKFPTGTAILGSDSDSDRITMLYYDDRRVSRHYNFAIDGNVWRWWRDDPGFAQRFTVTIEDGGGKMIGKGEMSRDGSKWEPDLDLTYVRDQR